MMNQILRSWKGSALFGAPLTLGAQDKLPLLPLPVSGTGGYSPCKVTEGVSGQGGCFRTRRRHSAFQQLTTNKTTAMESMKVGYVYGLTTTWTSCRSFAEKQKVGSVSGNPPPPSRNPLRYLTLLGRRAVCKLYSSYLQELHDHAL